MFFKESSSPMAVEVNKISKTFRTTKALEKVDLKVMEGEMVALIGPSGSGKSTLLRLLSGLDRADNHSFNTVRILGSVIQKNGSLARDVREIRANVGFIFQQFNLVGRLTLLTNILTGMLARVPTWRTLSGSFTRAERMEALEALERVGMLKYAGQRTSTLSGGQQQRGAIARALVQQARVILADEPIASLDPQSAKKVMETLSTLNQEDGLTVLVSLHQIDYAFRFCPRSIALKNGRVVFDGPTGDLNPDLLRHVYGDQLLEEDEELILGGQDLAVPAWKGARGGEEGKRSFSAQSLT